ncbi:UNVERIFIED_ORG: 4-alpha-L-fucosyltransferase (glycosyl transferase family 56) [Idiomarina abyssalis]|uniref:TDP-N-acetylfucosamine:lipid II N-acetylfucosaminyltransferase n=1 Tax=Idiomarina sp. 017G TaxID=2183988 RepID=UPI000E0E3038|nr:TDP-N-acetylfucosamine:lipid II N-acetylfucosaminyltransferase [Idiomarina sp. 017G]TDO50239.1 4-alpha-L-fucosyltransferase (glycosyl transferase family 56) [Idiomarina sp. 017G]
MILHVANLDKFIPPFVKLINENFDGKKHLFCVLGNNKKYPIRQQNNLKISKPTLIGVVKHYARVFRDIQRAEKVILHGLFDIRLIILLSMMPWVLKKCYWIIWGGDLYFYQTPKPRKRDKIKEAFRSFVIKRLGYLVTYIPGDVALARKWYKAQGTYKECLMYLSNIVDDQLIKSTSQLNKSDSETIKIVIGNSADPSNNHIEILKKLAVYKNKNIRLIVPLSYGDKENAEKVISYGRQEFGDKFEPLTAFIPLSDYKGILKSIDIAMFNHKRQQAMGNTITLLGMGKVVFLRSDVTQWSLFRKLGVVVKDINEVDLFSRLEDDELARNIHIIKSYFNCKTLVMQYERIFSK